MSATEKANASTIQQPGDRVPLPMDPETQKALLTDLSRIDAIRRRFDVVAVTQPAEGSVATAERADKLRGYAYDHAAMALAAAMDHVQAWRSLLQGAGEMPAFGHLTLLRTVHESALLAFWLTEPGIDPDLRRARGVAAQWDDLDERRKFEEAMGSITFVPPGKSAADRLSDLMAMADKAGLTKLDKKGDKILAIAKPPGTVELFDLYEPAVRPPAKPQAFYRLWSGYAHGKQWAQGLVAEPRTVYDSSGHSLALVQGSDGMAIEATRRAVAAMERAVAAYEKLWL